MSNLLRSAVEARGERPAEVNPDAVVAAQPPKAKPLSFIVRYPKGCEAKAKLLEAEINEAGYSVKYLIRADQIECQHEQIIDMSARADAERTRILKEKVSDLANCPWPWL